MYSIARATAPQYFAFPRLLEKFPSSKVCREFSILAGIGLSFPQVATGQNRSLTLSSGRWFTATRGSINRPDSYETRPTQPVPSGQIGPPTGYPEQSSQPLETGFAPNLTSPSENARFASRSVCAAESAIIADWGALGGFNTPDCSPAHRSIPEFKRKRPKLVSCMDLGQLLVSRKVLFYNPSPAPSLEQGCGTALQRLPLVGLAEHRANEFTRGGHRSRVSGVPLTLFERSGFRNAEGSRKI